MDVFSYSSYNLSNFSMRPEISANLSRYSFLKLKYLKIDYCYISKIIGKKKMYLSIIDIYLRILIKDLEKK